MTSQKYEQINKPNISGLSTGMGVGRGGVKEKVEYIKPNISGLSTGFGVGRGGVKEKVEYIKPNKKRSFN